MRTHVLSRSELLGSKRRLPRDQQANKVRLKADASTRDAFVAGQRFNVQ